MPSLNDIADQVEALQQKVEDSFRTLEVKASAVQGQYNSLYCRYVGVLHLLSEAARYAPEDLRERIARAMADAAANHPNLVARGTQIDVEIKP